MIGALKCCGAGARALRNVAPPTSVGVSESYSAFGDYGRGTLNWSQKRFLRSIPPSSSSEPGNVNAQFTVNEIENQRKRLIVDSGNKLSNSKKSLSKENYRRSIRGHQSCLSSLLPYMESGKRETEIVAEMYKIIIENGSPKIRVKSNKDDVLVKEWIGIQNELQIIKHDRIEDDKRKLQIAGQQALREMEASLRKGMNLEDLDQAIEGALCSELKAEYSQQKSSHDN